MISKYFRSITLAVMLMLSGVLLVGCGVSAEEYAQLETLEKEVASLEKQASSLKDQRSKLEREIAEKNRKLEECAKLKQETKANLEKLGK